MKVHSSIKCFRTTDVLVRRHRLLAYGNRVADNGRQFPQLFQHVVLPLDLSVGSLSDSEIARLGEVLAPKSPGGDMARNRRARETHPDKRVHAAYNSGVCQTI